MPEFDPNAPGVANGSFFALPWTHEEAALTLLSVPWDVTTSYRAGTSLGPQAMVEASTQIDLYDAAVPRAWEIPIHSLPFPQALLTQNEVCRPSAERVIAAWAAGLDAPRLQAEDLARVNEACEEMNRFVREACLAELQAGKLVGLVGGEHSVPLGYYQALARHYPGFGILHIDAHADLREAYEGFTYSHASIMYNALQIPQVEKLVQVGIRDYCTDEAELMQAHPKVCAFPNALLQRALFEGGTWQDRCRDIIAQLPPYVHISLDIDGLLPELCPHTGTPVPGGLSYDQLDYLLYALATSGKRIVGFDLCEVAPAPEGTDEWDANVGARILYKLCVYTYLNNKK